MFNHVLMICCFLYMSNIIYGQDENVILVGQQVPDFVINSENGETIKMNDFKGKIVLITFFATWCAPCRKELPLLQEKIWFKYRDNSNFCLLIFGRGHSLEEIDKFKRAYKFDLPIYPDYNGSIFNLFAKNSVPRNYIIDKTGVVLYSSEGFSNQEFNKMISFIESLLRKS